MVALAIGLPTIMWFVGGLLGSAVANLLGSDRARLIPAYRRRVLTVSVLLGLCLWALVPLYYLSGGFAVDGIPWLRWAPLWSYGLLGLGFIGGAVQSDLIGSGDSLSWSRENWLRSLLLTMVWLVPTLIGFNPVLRDWLNAPLDAALPGVTAMAMLCLMLGPLSWPAVVLLREGVRTDKPVVKRSVAEQMRSGGNAAWGLAAIARRTHGQGHLRIDFLVFQPTLLSVMTAPLIFAACFGVFQVVWTGLEMVGMVSAPLFEINWNSALFGMFVIPLTPIFSGAIDLPRLGRGLLLPGQFKRQNLPVQLFKRLLSVWIGGVLVAMIPIAAIALWSGTPASELAFFSILLAWGVSTTVSFEFFHAPRAERKAAIDPVRIVLFIALLLLLSLAKPFLFDSYPPWLFLTVIACAFVIPVALYRLGLTRWKTMEYGA
jgi:hypothetical protein